MGFAEDLVKLSEKVSKNLPIVIGEENTKAAFISPFLSILGYDITDPSEVRHEYFADFGTPTRVKQPKKVDYAIAINSNIVMLVEAKSCKEKPETHDGQLRSYFNAILTVQISVVTNGVEYRFFTDLENLHMMDKEAFFTFNILDYTSKDIENLKLFHRDNFDASSIKNDAEEMLYSQGISELIDGLLVSPSDKFVHFLIKELGTVAPKFDFRGSVVNARVINRFKPIVKRSLQSSLLSLITRSVNQEMTHPADDQPLTRSEHIDPDIDKNLDAEEKADVITTQEELAAFNRIQTITQTSAKFNIGIQHRDTVSYFGINLGKTTWWFLRLYLSSGKKSFIARISADEAKILAPDFVIQDVPGLNSEMVSKVKIDSVNDFDRLKPLILRCYEMEATKH